MVGALIQGFRRAAFSNEAGVGSAAIAHSAVRTKEPVTEGTCRCSSRSSTRW
jgi:alanine or glycine:cation symporter, AGCS family